MPPGSEEEPEAVKLPRWIPVTIAGVLVALAALAVYTGMQYRDTTLVDIVKPRKASSSERRGVTSAPRGEPEAGASLVIADQSGDVVPVAGEPVTGEARAVITGGPAGVEATVRMWARRGMMFTIDPAEAVIYVNEIPIGSANQFDTPDEIYDFAEPGSYNVRIEAPGHKARRFIVTSADSATDDVAHIRVALPKA